MRGSGRSARTILFRWSARIPNDCRRAARRNGLRTTLLAALLAGARAPGQQNADVRGDELEVRVLDTAGKPIADALVRIEPIRDPAKRSLDGPEEFHEAGLSQLRCTPLPSARSGADGTARMPLTRDQRRLGAVAGRRLDLVIEKEGFVRWHGPVGICPGRVGSLEARLRRSAGGVVRGRLIRPPGKQGPLSGRVEVTWDEDARSMAELAQGVADDTRIDGVPRRLLVAVAADGTFEFPTDCEDGPSIVTLWGRVETRGYHVEATVEGCDGFRPWFPRDCEQVEIELLAVAAREPLYRVEVGPGVTPPAAMTVVWCSERGSVWRRTVPFGPIVPLARWRPAAVEAEGFCGALLPGPGEAAVTVLLERLPADGIRLRVRSKDGAAAAAVVELDPDWYFAQTGASWGARARGDRSPSRFVAGAEGLVHVPPAHLARAALVRVSAEGHVPWAGDTNGCAHVRELTLEPLATGTVRIRVIDPAGKPVDGAALLFSRECFRGSSLPAAPPVTDARRPLMAVLAEGVHRCLAVHEGFACEVKEWNVVRGTELDVDITLVPAGTGHVRMMREDGAALPWQGVAQVFARPHARPPAMSPLSITDARGAARLDGLALGRELPLFVRGPSAGLLTIDPGLHVNRFELEAPPLFPVWVRCPEPLDGATLHFRSGIQSGAARIADRSPRDLLVHLPAGAAVISLRSPWFPLLSGEVEVEVGREPVVDWRMDRWPEVVVDLVGAGGAELPQGIRAEHVDADPERLDAKFLDLPDIAARWRERGDPPSRLRIRVPPAETIAVELRHPGLVPKRFTVAGGKPAVHTITVERR